MNKHDFYKQLMKEYTFDSAKVRRYAKNSSSKLTLSDRIGSPRFRRGWWKIPSTAAVAAFAVIIGIIAFGPHREQGIPTVTTPFGKARIDLAKSEISKVVSSISSKKMYLSFNDTISFTEMQSAFSEVSDTDITVEAVYVLENKDKGKNNVTVISLSNSDNAEELINDENIQIIGAKVEAPAMLIENLSNRQEVALLELENEVINDDTFVPLAVEIQIIETASTDVTTAETTFDSIDETAETTAPPTEMYDETLETTAPDFEAASEMVETTAPDVIGVSTGGNY